MWLSVLEITFGVLFVLGVITQLIWPLLTDAPLFPWFGKHRKRQRPTHKHAEKAIGGEVIDIRHTHTGDKK